MAITMSNATVDTSERDSLLQSSVNGGAVEGGVTANTRTEGGVFGLFGEEVASGQPLAGVTASFAANVSQAIETYKSNVQTELDKLQNVESNGAFRGEAITTALANFVNAVREVGTQYLERLSSAETQIINSVAQAYQTQDTDLSGNLNSDSGSIGING